MCLLKLLELPTLGLLCHKSTSAPLLKNEPVVLERSAQVSDEAVNELERSFRECRLSGSSHSDPQLSPAAGAAGGTSAGASREGGDSSGSPGESPRCLYCLHESSPNPTDKPLKHPPCEFKTCSKISKSYSLKCPTCSSLLSPPLDIPKKPKTPSPFQSPQVPSSPSCKSKSSSGPPPFTSTRVCPPRNAPCPLSSPKLKKDTSPSATSRQSSPRPPPQKPPPVSPTCDTSWKPMPFLAKLWRSPNTPQEIPRNPITPLPPESPKPLCAPNRTIPNPNLPCPGVSTPDYPRPCPAEHDADPEPAFPSAPCPSLTELSPPSPGEPELSQIPSDTIPCSSYCASNPNTVTLPKSGPPSSSPTSKTQNSRSDSCDCSDLVTSSKDATCDCSKVCSTRCTSPKNSSVNLTDAKTTPISLDASRVDCPRGLDLCPSPCDAPCSPPAPAAAPSPAPSCADMPAQLIHLCSNLEALARNIRLHNTECKDSSACRNDIDHLYFNTENKIDDADDWQQCLNDQEVQCSKSGAELGTADAAAGCECAPVTETIVDQNSIKTEVDQSITEDEECGAVGGGGGGGAALRADYCQDKLQATLQILRNKEATVAVQDSSLALAEQRIRELAARLRERERGTKEMSEKLARQATKLGCDGPKCRAKTDGELVSESMCQKDVVATLQESLGVIQELYRECFYEAAKQDELIEKLRGACVEVRAMERERSEQVGRLQNVVNNQKWSLGRCQDIAAEVESLKSEICNFLSASSNNDSGQWSGGEEPPLEELVSIQTQLRALHDLLAAECDCALEIENKKLKTENDNMKKELGELCHKTCELNETLKESENKLKTLEKQNQEKDAELVTLRERVELAAATQQQKTQECSCLERQLKMLQDELSAKTEQLASSEQQCASLRAAVEKLQRELETAEQLNEENACIRRELSELTSEVCQWREQLSVSQQRVSAVEAELLAAREHCRHLDTCYRDKVKSLKEVESQLFVAESRGSILCDEARGAVRALRGWVQGVKRTNKIQQQKIKEQQAEIARLECQLQLEIMKNETLIKTEPLTIDNDTVSVASEPAYRGNYRIDPRTGGISKQSGCSACAPLLDTIPNIKVENTNQKNSNIKVENKKLPLKIIPNTIICTKCANVAGTSDMNGSSKRQESLIPHAKNHRTSITKKIPCDKHTCVNRLLREPIPNPEVSPHDTPSPNVSLHNDTKTPVTNGEYKKTKNKENNVTTWDWDRKASTARNAKKVEDSLKRPIKRQSFSVDRQGGSSPRWSMQGPSSPTDSRQESIDKRQGSSIDKRQSTSLDKRHNLSTVRRQSSIDKRPITSTDKKQPLVNRQPTLATVRRQSSVNKRQVSSPERRQSISIDRRQVPSPERRQSTSIDRRQVPSPERRQPISIDRRQDLSTDRRESTLTDKREPSIDTQGSSIDGQCLDTERSSLGQLSPPNRPDIERTQLIGAKPKRRLPCEEEYLPTDRWGPEAASERDRAPGSAGSERDRASGGRGLCWEGEGVRDQCTGAVAEESESFELVECRSAALQIPTRCDAAAGQSASLTGRTDAAAGRTDAAAGRSDAAARHCDAYEANSAHCRHFRSASPAALLERIERLTECHEEASTKRWNKHRLQPR